ncbi:MAG: T9SS type A sorting domain-containing protein [Bacteroidales bacterium]|nr:T9SS type A sorting domain-containing protein [Bacteroidales bacterium]
MNRYSIKQLIVIGLSFFLMTVPVLVKGQGHSASSGLLSEQLHLLQPDGKQIKMMKAFLAHNLAVSPVRQNAVKSGSTGKFRLDEVLQEAIDSVSGIAKPEYKVTYTYDSLGRMQSQTEREWSGSSEQWLLIYKDELYYGAHGKISKYIDYNYDQGREVWVPSYKSDYAYDTDGVLRMSGYYEFDQADQTWWLGMNSLYYYNDQGQNVLGMTYVRNNPDDDWEVGIKQNLFYNEAGLPARDQTYFWIPGLSEWSAFWELAYQYDEYGNLTRRMINSWSSSEGSFMPRLKEEFTYDYTCEIASVILPGPSWLSGSASMAHKPTGSSGYELNGTNWVPESRNTYIYSEMSSTGSLTLKPGRAKVFPNPAPGIIGVELENAGNTATIDIFDVAGRKILSAKFTGSTSIDLTDHPENVLFYVLISEGIKQSGKIFINH